MLRPLSISITAIAALIIFWPEPEPDKRVLFIGNSYTFGGEIPKQIKYIAQNSTPSFNYEVEMHVRGGTTLETHLIETDPLASIQSEDWDVIFLQDASVMSFREHYVDSMKLSTRVLAQAAQAQGAEVMYFAHWAPGIDGLEKRGAVQKIEQTYTEIAQQTGGTVAKSGRLWQMAQDAGIKDLYAPDGHHSSVKGAYSAALALTVALGDVDPTTSNWHPEQVSEKEHKILLQVTQDFMTLEQ